MNIAIKVQGPDGEEIALLKEPLIAVINEHMAFIEAYESSQELVKGYLRGLHEIKEFIRKQDAD